MLTRGSINKDIYPLWSTAKTRAHRACGTLISLPASAPRIPFPSRLIHKSQQTSRGTTRYTPPIACAHQPRDTGQQRELCRIHSSSKQCFRRQAKVAIALHAHRQPTPGMLLPLKILPARGTSASHQAHRLLSAARLGFHGARGKHRQPPVRSATLQPAASAANSSRGVAAQQ
jgi:hypothetical protein